MSTATLVKPLTWRILFAVAIVVAVTFALLPHPPHLPIDSLGDKFEHSLAFVVMALLAAAAWPAAALLRIGERLSFFGALIEVCQSIPFIHRDCDMLDWLTDTIAITVALLLVRAWRRRSAAEPVAQTQPLEI